MVEITANLAAIAAAGGWLVFGPIAVIVLCCVLWAAPATVLASRQARRATRRTLNQR